MSTNKEVIEPNDRSEGGSCDVEYGELGVGKGWKGTSRSNRSRVRLVSEG